MALYMKNFRGFGTAVRSNEAEKLKSACRSYLRSAGRGLLPETPLATRKLRDPPPLYPLFV